MNFTIQSKYKSMGVRYLVIAVSFNNLSIEIDAFLLYCLHKNIYANVFEIRHFCTA
jgi:hypothetical protein